MQSLRSKGEGDFGLVSAVISLTLLCPLTDPSFGSNYDNTGV